ncbi:MAG TPA: methyl-accepting chemotaxis protein [Negativicutes bacterium]|nr:methyl-accepting chemotaxis protein [Negativicutes bacterium]
MKSIQTKLTVIILTVFIIALGTLSGLNYWKARSIVTENISADMTKLVQNSAGDISDWIEARKAEMSIIAMTPEVIGGNAEIIYPFLVNVAGANKVYDGIGYIRPDGTYLNSAGSRGSLAERDYFQHAIKGEIYVSDPVLSKSSGKAIVAVAVPVKSGGRVVGVVYGSIGMEGLAQKVQDIKVGKTGYAYVLQADGLAIIHPNKDIMMKVNAATDTKLPEVLRSVNQRVIKGETGQSSYEYSGSEKMVAYAPVPGIKWFLGINVPTEEVTGALLALRNISLITIVIVLVIASAIIALISRRIAKPIQTLEGAANRIAGGDLSQTSLGIASNDEIGRLAKSFEQMAQNVRALIKQIHSNAEQLAASSEELTASAEQSAQASNQVAISMTDVAAGANDQLAATTDTSAIVEEMSAGIEQIAANANLVSGQSEQAAGKAINGGAAVDKAVSQMTLIENTVNTSAQVVAKLGERSKEIGQIVDTISGIAGQTNLLALNAAIEAARAGEQGRGFAVVAEEVRKLAEQSEEAAKKIASLIGEIQTDTDKAVEAMNNGTREVKTGADVVNAAGVSFREIADLVTEVSDQVKQMSGAIQQMATGSQHIVGSVKKIGDLSKKSVGEAQSVSAATEEQLASMEEISTSSRALATLAQELQGAVAKFRI